MNDRQARPTRPTSQAPDQSRRPGPRVSPGFVFLAIAVVGSIAYTLYAITVRDASQIPLLASGAAVLAIAFGALAVYCLRASWRAGGDGRGGWALLVALVGGGAAMATAGFLAAAVILFRLASGGG